MANQPRLTRDQQREAARAKARELRQKQQANEKRKKLSLQLGLVGGLALVVAIIVFAVTTSPQARPGLTPSVVAGFNNGGIKIGQGLKAIVPPSSTASATPTATPTSTPGPSAVPNITIYLDYQCPFCQHFEAANNDQIKKLVSDGTATLEVHPISFLDSNSNNHYSSRAANAAYCVAENSPDTFFAYNAYLYANQPGEGTYGPENDALYQDAVDLGATNTPKIKKCINDGAYNKWISDTTKSLVTGATTIPGTTFNLKGTPFVMVNNQQYTYETDAQLTDPARFAAFIQTVASL